MTSILNHWHCILPIVAIVAAMFFMRDKPKSERKNKKNWRADE
jgi:cytochrome b561